MNVPAPVTHPVQLRRETLGVLLILVAQFLLGMATNLFVAVPRSHPGSGAADYFSGAFRSVIWSFSSGIPLLIVHVVLGLLLVASSIRLIVAAVRRRRRSAIWLSSLAGFGVVFAGFNGASFLVYNEDFSSMLMSAGFALAVGCYVLLLGGVGATESSGQALRYGRGATASPEVES